jgi:hypothetical protein
MLKKRIALLACSNGMGHTRRLLSLALALRSQGAQPILFAEEYKLKRLCEAYQILMPEFISFSSRTERKDWMEEGAPDWIRNLPDLKDFDEVVSDNLIEVLAFKPNTWLSGNFFWHHALKEFPSKKYRYAESLLQQYNPRMIASGIFAAPYLHSSTRLSLVGMYAFPDNDMSAEKTDFLISCGLGGGVSKETSELVYQLAKGPKPICRTLWIEPSLYLDGMPPWIQPATFSLEMFARLICAIIRPGVGTVTDALLAGARVFSFFEPGNSEMISNAARIADAGVGKYYKTAFRAWQAAVDFAANTSEHQAHYAAVIALNRDGAIQASTLILQGGVGQAN